MQYIIVDTASLSASVVVADNLMFEHKGRTYTGTVKGSEFIGTCKNRQGVVVASGTFSTNGFDIIDVKVNNTHVKLENGELRGTTSVKYLDEIINCTCTLKNEEVGLCIKSVSGSNDKYSINGIVEIHDDITFKYGIVRPINTDIEYIEYTEKETIIKYVNNDTFTGIVKNLDKVSGTYEKPGFKYIGTFKGNICEGTCNGVQGTFNIVQPTNITIDGDRWTVLVKCFDSFVQCTCNVVDGKIISAFGNFNGILAVCTEPVITDNILKFNKKHITFKSHFIKDIVEDANSTTINYENGTTLQGINDSKDTLNGTFTITKHNITLKYCGTIGPNNRFKGSLYVGDHFIQDIEANLDFGEYTI